jgi:hypothetical protein
MSNFTADQVWACAAAAQRINGEYLKEDKGYYTNDGWVLEKKANKVMVKNWLREGNFSLLTAADYEAGVKARNHFKSYTLLALTGQMNEFQSTAMRIAAKDEFTNRDMYDFAVISCLPSVAERDAARTELKREVYASEQLQGAIGEIVTGEITVLQCRYNQNYNKYRITARMGESFIDFWHSKDLLANTNYCIKGKIKNVRGDKTTQLNFVKIKS